MDGRILRMNYWCQRIFVLKSSKICKGLIYPKQKQECKAFTEAVHVASGELDRCKPGKEDLDTSLVLPNFVGKAS